MITSLRKSFLAAALLLPVAAAAQGTATPAAPSTHTVKRGETLTTIARKVKHPDVTQNQMLLALARANMHVLRARSVDRLNVGSKLTIPDRATVAATDAPTADREVATILRTEQRYKEAVKLERGNEHKAAFDAYLDAGKQGHALAELRLGELYDKGSPAVQRDMQESARWFQKARAQGVDVPKAETRSPVTGMR
jgi:FimV-like protein